MEMISLMEYDIYALEELWYKRHHDPLEKMIKQKGFYMTTYEELNDPGCRAKKLS